MEEKRELTYKITDLERALKEMKAKNSEMIKKNKAIEEREAKLSQTLKPRLNQAIEQQRYIADFFNQIKEDTELLPQIFRAEAAVREKSQRAQLQAERNAKEAMDQMGELQTRISNLEKDKARAMQLSMRAIAARSNIK